MNSKNYKPIEDHPFCVAVPLWVVGCLLFAGSVAMGTPQRLSAQPKLDDQDYQRHLVELQKKLPAKGFSILVEKPFVVVGDEPTEMLERRCRSIRWALFHKDGSPRIKGMKFG